MQLMGPISCAPLLATQKLAGPLSREQIAAKYLTAVYDTGEMMALFTVQSFMAPFVIVTRKADGVTGSLEFQHSPRYYYSFVRDE